MKQMQKYFEELKDMFFSKKHMEQDRKYDKYKNNEGLYKI